MLSRRLAKENPGSEAIPTQEPIWSGAVVALLLAGIAASVATFLHLRQLHDEHLRAELEQRASAQIAALQQRVDRDVTVLQGLAGLFDSFNSVDRDTFRRFSSGILERNEGIQALEWVPRVPVGDRARFEAALSAEGHPGFVIRERSPTGRVGRGDGTPGVLPGGLR